MSSDSGQALSHPHFAFGKILMEAQTCLPYYLSRKLPSSSSGPFLNSSSCPYTAPQMPGLPDFTAFSPFFIKTYQSPFPFLLSFALSLLSP